jgi:hypothetical protein
MKKSNYSFFILQLLFAAVLTSTIVFIGCSRNNTGTDPTPPGGEIVFAYNVDLTVDGPGSDLVSPIWYDKGITTIIAHISFKADPQEPVSGVPVDFTVSGGGILSDFDTGKEIGRVARVYTNDSGNALVFYSTVGEVVTKTKTIPDGKGGYVTIEYPWYNYTNQTTTACVDEAKIANQYENCKTVTIFLNGPVNQD